MVASMNYGWQNAIDQLKIVNARVGLNTEGVHRLKKVVDGQIVIPEEYRDMELKEEEEDGDEEVEEEIRPDGDKEDASMLVCPPPQLEPPIVSWVLSHGTETMKLVSRVVLVGQ
ncbi:hypothetical protein A2U01_0027376 [Trifolium medium]|uniref:Uncharacterized protein n=1 Tax=Trifolium medium TaxID=97028 RepID=A0A392P2U4_9FABA|nr:hypothetical protein [Trifolium medium]